MKIAVIGGAGVRTPLLVNGLTHSDLPIDEIALFDIDRERLAIVAGLARAYSPVVRECADARSCVADADFVFLSIRAGGVAARACDEAAALELGVVGQETVGAAGFAMAMRNIRPAVDYAALVRRAAPRAWIINFTNPVGIVTQAMTAHGYSRAIGICDTPTELFADVAHALQIPSSACFFDYFGLNHLGWLREVYAGGEPLLERLWRDPARLARIYRAPLFEPRFLHELRLLPTEYLFYYYRPAQAIANTTAAGRTRGRDIAELNDRLFRDLAAAAGQAPQIYEDYLRARSAGYMQIESGGSSPAAPPVSNELTGYDKIALAVVRAIWFNSNAIIPLDVPNNGAISSLDAADVVEVPCVVNTNGARPLNVGAIPDRERLLLTTVKEYERLTVAAALTPSADAATRALAHNPLVGDADLARRLLDRFAPLW